MTEPETVEALEETPQCLVPDCPGDILVTVGGETWCVNHRADDWLPVLAPGSFMRGCVSCGRGTIWVLAVDPDTGMHPHCLRRWAAGVPAVEIRQETAPVGAYARRRRSS